MRKAQFDVPQALMTAFAKELVESNLENSIISSDDDEVTIEVSYEKDDTDQVDELEEKLDELTSELEEENEEEE